MLFADSTSSSSERVTPNSRWLRAKWLPRLLSRNKEIPQIIKQALPEIHEEGDQILLEVLTG